MTSGEDDLDDSDLFRQAMLESGVRPAHRQKNKITHEQKKPLSKQTAIQSRKSNPASVAAPVRIDQTTEGPYALFVRSGVSKSTLKKLRNGLLRIEESIDLHGMRSQQATRALQIFLEESLEHGYECIEIVHGKGQRSEQAGGILKPMTIHWLKQRPEVLAFCSAIPSHGGSGATCVLLGYDFDSSNYQN